MNALKFGAKLSSFLTSKSISRILLIGLLLAVMVLNGYAAQVINGEHYGSNPSDNEIASDLLSEYVDNIAPNYYNNEKRSGGCLRKGLSCEHRSEDCCPDSACRCNLWGTNCRCKRLGLLQRYSQSYSMCVTNGLIVCEDGAEGR